MNIIMCYICLFISHILYPKPTFPCTGCQWRTIDNKLTFGHYIGHGYFKRWLDYTDNQLEKNIKKIV